MSSQNKHHWYDGKFYDKVIAPNQDEIFKKIQTVIPKGSSVLDFGCGTGRLPFLLSDKCSSVTGIDLSLKNISLAIDNLRISNLSNVTFIHGGVDRLSVDRKYDFVTMSFVIHEVPSLDRITILKKIKSHCDKLIIADYSMNRTLPNRLLNEAVEFIAGRDHYRNYKDYLEKGGITYLLKETGYSYKLIEDNAGFSAAIYIAKPINHA